MKYRFPRRAHLSRRATVPSSGPKRVEPFYALSIGLVYRGPAASVLGQGRAAATAMSSRTRLQALDKEAEYQSERRPHWLQWGANKRIRVLCKPRGYFYAGVAPGWLGLNQINFRIGPNIVDYVPLIPLELTITVGTNAGESLLRGDHRQDVCPAPAQL